MSLLRAEPCGWKWTHNEPSGLVMLLHLHMFVHPSPLDVKKAINNMKKATPTLWAWVPLPVVPSRVLVLKLHASNPQLGQRHATPPPPPWNRAQNGQNGPRMATSATSPHLSGLQLGPNPLSWTGHAMEPNLAMEAPGAGLLFLEPLWCVVKRMFSAGFAGIFHRFEIAFF